MLTDKFLREFRDANYRRLSEGFAPLEADWHSLDWVAALLGEVGEAINAVKKIRRLDCGVGSATEDARGLLVRAYQEECADCFVYLDLVAVDRAMSADRMMPSHDDLDVWWILRSRAQSEMGYWLYVNRQASRIGSAIEAGGDCFSAVRGTLASLITVATSNGWDFEAIVREKFNKTSDKIGCRIKL